MGSWGVGPFDSEDGGDFATELDARPEQEKVEFVRRALTNPVLFASDFDNEAPLHRAYAAAAVVAAHRLGVTPMWYIRHVYELGYVLFRTNDR